MVISIIIAGVLVGAALLFNHQRRQASNPAPIPQPVLTADVPTGQQPSPPEESFASKLGRLSEALAPLAEKSAHPREFDNWPEFRAVVDLLSEEATPLGVLRQYAFSGNWPLACAAFVVLKARPERNDLASVTVMQLPNLRPWTVHFALQFLCSLNQRPPVGAPVTVAPYWWAENLVIPDLFLEYFEARKALGDEPTFGESLAAASVPFAEITALLRRIDHPFATALLDRLEQWQRDRIDRSFLTTFGRFWDLGIETPLLVTPDAWKDQLDRAEAVVRHTTPRSILVTGETRIGKTSFLKLLGERLQASGWQVFEAGAAELMADQMYIGQLEGRVRRTIEELDTRKRLIWSVTDLSQFSGSGTHQGQSANLLDQIYPAMAAGRLIIMAETSPAAASRILQAKPSLRSVMEVCRLQPMNEHDATALANNVATAIERHLKLHISAGTITAATELSQQYLGTGQLPGALIELLKRSASTALSSGKSQLAVDNLLDTLSQISGLPRSILDSKERVELRSIRDFLSARVMGQDEAVGAVVDRIAMLKAGLVDPNRPIGVFLFAGPTGTGKTELAKALAEFLFGSAERMVRLDMSEFQTAESTAKILGARGDGSQTDSLIERVRKQPFSVVLLDEFEKAHANVWDLFLQIFDDGRLTDAAGRVADFRHTIIILTSNLGATSHRGLGVGFVPEREGYNEDQVLKAVGQTFRPEFVNRLDKILVFRPLSRDMMRNILRKELGRILDRRGLRRRDWAVEWEASAIEFLLDRGFSPEMGARPLKRAIDQHLLAPLAATLVEHRFPEGDQFLFVRSNGRSIEVEFVDPDADGNTSPPATHDSGAPSFAAMILRPTGDRLEIDALNAVYASVQEQLTDPEWGTLKTTLSEECAAEGIWAREERHTVFARLALVDRVEEAARTAGRLKQRLDSSANSSGRASRELVGRLALQLYLVQEGLQDGRNGAPVDALLVTEPALDAAGDNYGAVAWCARLINMYRQWAARRHMQLSEFAPPGAGGPIVLQVSGFGAFRTLQDEAGLHVLEDLELGDGARTVARVKVVPGPWQDPRPATAYSDFLKLLSQSPDSNTIIRRYRQGDAPLVRDGGGSWRSGKLDAVLGGDFDLIKAL